MAVEKAGEEHFSTLELVENDETAHGPEKDWAILAPEHDRTADLAQVSTQDALKLES